MTRALRMLGLACGVALAGAVAWGAPAQDGGGVPQLDEMPPAPEDAHWSVEPATHSIALSTSSRAWGFSQFA